MRPAPLVAVALALLAALPAGASADLAAGTTPGGELVIYDTAAPGTILERHAITGLEAGERIEGLDVRPVTGELFGLGITPVGPDVAGRLYRIDPGRGLASVVGTGPFSTTLAPSEFGFDFLPTVDRARIVSRADLNLRINPHTTQVTPDSNLNPDADVEAIAYDRNQAGATSTTLWGYDSADDRIVRIGGHNAEGATGGSPNTGMVFPSAAASGIVAAAGEVGMDVTPGDVVFMTAPTGAGPAYGLYTVNRAFGTVTLVGGFAEPVDDVAVLQRSAIALDGTSVAVGEGAGVATVGVTRSGNATGTQTVAYAATPASAGEADFTPSSGTLTFAPGETVETFTVPIASDAEDEPAETIALALSAPSGGAVLGTPASSTLTIDDDDPTPGPPAPPPPPDSFAPRLLIAAPTARTRRQVLAGIVGRLSLSEACTGTLRVLLGPTTLGSQAVGTTEIAVRQFRLRLSLRGRGVLQRRLRLRRSVRLTLAAECFDAARNRGTDRAALVVRRR